MNCKNCGKELTGKWQKEFCSRSCSASFNNKETPKRKRDPKRYCIDCKDVYVWRKNSRCPSCKQKHDDQVRNGRLLGDLLILNTSASAYNRVRKFARESVSRLGWEKKCAICGYDTYVELCHIQPIGSFSKETRLGVVNAPSNLIYLCPNHHKEFDLGLLDLGR